MNLRHEKLGGGGRIGGTSELRITLQPEKITYIFCFRINFLKYFGNGPNTVSENTVSNTGLSEFFGAH